MKHLVKRGQVTIYDIAEEAGVSPSTVSRVINNRPGVGPETRQRLKKLLKEHNYFPNETARSLVNRSSKSVGILIDDIRTIHHTQGAYIIERRLAEVGYSSIILNMGSDSKSHRDYIEVLRKRRVDGLVLMGSTFQNDVIKSSITEHLSDIPVIMANGYLDLPNTYGILADEQNGIANCVELLYKQGRTNLVFVIDTDTPSNKLKQLGFEQATNRLGLADKAAIYRSESSLAGAYNATQKIVKERPNVDGIIYTVDLIATSAVRALTDMDISIPDQIAVIGVDNSIYGEISNPKLTSLDNKLLDLSMAAAETLINVLKKRTTAKKVLIYSSIVERETN